MESCAGGGKGGHISCGYSLTGAFSGTLTANGSTQSINGNTSQSFAVGGAPSGVTAYNSAFTPFYFSDTESIHRADDINGTNLTTFSAGFYGAEGIALDSAGRIYVADTYNERIVRFDNMNGDNLVVYGGTYGSGPGAFTNPTGIAVDASGRIYVFDAGNAQVVRMDDMNGTNWVAYGAPGNGVGQFAAYGMSLALDASNRIYVADTGNSRIVRFDDMTGTNWTSLSSISPAYGVTYSLNSPVAVTVDPAGKIYIANDTTYQPQIVRVDDMTGTNWTSIFMGSGPSPHSIALDSTGAIYTGGYGVQITDNMMAVVPSTSNNVCPLGCYYIFGLTPIPQPSPRPSAVSFVPNNLSFTQNLGTTGTATMTITNFGGSTLNLGSVTTSTGFGATNNCPAALPAGSNCAVVVTFTPTATGSYAGTLTIGDDSGNAGTTQTVLLSGTGTIPAATLSATSVGFGSQVQGTTSGARTITITNTGTGNLQFTSITAPAPFAQTNTCLAAAVVPSGTCTISVTFAPTAVGSASQTLSLVDNAGTQSVSLTGTGTGQVTLSATSLSLGTIAVGSTTSAKTVTLTNHASTAISFASIVTAAPFAIASNTCGTSVAAAATCTVGVTFTPSAAGNASGTLTFTDSALNSPQVVTLSGTGGVAGGSVTVSPTNLTFPSQPTGTTSASMSVTVSNTGSTTVTNNGITITGDFAETTSCTSSITAGKSCTINVTFSPTVSGTRTGTLTINVSSGVQTVSLSGTSAVSNSPGALSLSATTLTFSGYTIGDNPSKSVTVSNTGGTAVGIGSVTIAGNAAFTERTTCGASLAAGATCTITVTFRPTAYGTFTSTVTLTEGSGAQHLISVSGNSSVNN